MVEERRRDVGVCACEGEDAMRREEGGREGGCEGEGGRGVH